MKRFYYLAIAAAVAMLALASCTKDNSIQKDAPQSGPFEITITGEMGGFDISTKSEVESVIRMKWNTTDVEDEQDVVWVYGYDGSTFKSLSEEGLKATSSAENPYTATLRGSITEMPQDGNIYLVHCPSDTYTKPEVSTSGGIGSISFDMSAVEQGPDVTPFIICSAVNVSGTELSGLTARFSFATTVVKVNVTGLDASAELTKATFSGINRTCTLSFNGGEATVAAAPASPSADDLGTFTKTLSGTATASGKTTFLLGIPALSEKADRKLTVISGDKTYNDNGVFPGAHSANSYVNTICCVKPSLLLPGKFSVSSSKQVQFTRGNLYYSTTDSAYHIEAAQNVTYATLGQTAYRESHVCHFFWSNTTDWQTSGMEPWKQFFNYSALNTSDVFFCGVDNPMTVDDQSGLYALTGDSNGEWYYIFRLRANAINLYQTGVSVTIGENTVNNCMVIAPDECLNSYIFDKTKTSYTAEEWAVAESAGLVCLPAAGSQYNYYLENANSYGYYWSASPSPVGDSFAYHLYVTNGVPEPLVNYRHYGLSIRLVSTVSN